MDNDFWLKEIIKLEGWHFGGKGSGLEDKLLDLVVKGIKTATCSWFELYELENKPLPKLEKSYIMNSNDDPVCVVETTSVTIHKFLDVDEEIAYLEGEGDRSLKFKVVHLF